MRRYLVKFALCLLFLTPVVLFMSVGSQTTAELLHTASWPDGVLELASSPTWIFRHLLRPSQLVATETLSLIVCSMFMAVVAACVVSGSKEASRSLLFVASLFGSALSFPISSFVFGWLLYPVSEAAFWIAYGGFLALTIALFMSTLSLMACCDRRRWQLWDTPEIGEPVPFARFRREEE